MKILLINPPIENTIGSVMPKELEEGLDFLPPLGLMYIAAYLEKETNHNVEILDCPVLNINHKELKNKIKEKNPDVIGITAMTFTLIDVIKTIKNSKTVNPNIKIILGGPHIIIYPEETINIPGVDFLVLGEGEKTVKYLLENINGPDKLKNTKGLVFRYNNELINNGRTDFLKNLDDLPFPARHLTPYKEYFSILSSRRPVTTMFTSRGCPYQCLFCDRPQFGKNFRARSAKNVVDEIEECQKIGIKEIFFYDDTFAIDKQRVLDVCGEIRKRNLTVAWDIRTRVNTVDEEILKALKESNCQRIHYGVEAGTQKILNILRKGITLGHAEKAFKLTKKAGIETAAYFMIGSPTETREDILKTAEFIKKLNPDYLHVSITTPFPATDLYKMAIEEGVIPTDVWRAFAQNPDPNFIPPTWNKELSRKELLLLLKIIYRSFYLRPIFIFKTFLKIKSLDDLFKKAIAAFKIFKI